MSSELPPFDASVILNMHREATVLKPTLLSLAKAVRVAAGAGLRTELVAVFDRSDDATRDVFNSFDLSDFADVQIIESDNGSLGLSRNDGIDRARGEYLLTSDADDLISDTYILETLKYVRTREKNSLYFPQYVLAFGSLYYITNQRDLEEVTPLAFIDMHPYISRICAHYTIFKTVRYDDLHLNSGYAYEDWHFNAEAIAHGISLRVVPGTILFYRQSPGSLVRAAAATSTKQISPTKLFEPDVYLKVCAPYYAALSRMAETWTRAAPAYSDPLTDKEIIRIVQAANAIEPEIDLPKFKQLQTYSNASSHLEAGLAYYEICEVAMGKCFREVALLPDASLSEASTRVLDALHERYRQDPLADVLVIFGDRYGDTRLMEDLPPNAVPVDIGFIGHKLDNVKRGLLALKLIEASAAGARLHLLASPFADAFLSSFRPILSQFECVYHRSGDSESLYERRHQGCVSSSDRASKTGQSERNITLAKKSEERLIDLRRVNVITQRELERRYREQVAAFEVELSLLRDQNDSLLSANTTLQDFQRQVTSSRAHRLASGYLKFTQRNAYFVRLTRPLRRLVGASIRLVRKVVARHTDQY
ncbi:glycosyltransferase family 2 protein [Microvirga sp. 2MCAF38]|uniref:glycosyltransferase family 2 protein n=1 Tax=Microvirga sp. 2MCAF38 TaxID=3232989 RepID=UPI003F96B831